MRNFIELPSKPVTESSEAFCSSNIALCKYWGKQNQVNNIPNNSSLSISLANIGTRASITEGASDMLMVSGSRISNDKVPYKRLFAWLDSILGNHRPRLYINTFNSMPMGVGFASSASSYAAISECLHRFFGWDLSKTILSIVARTGSASAARSIYNGFVKLPARIGIHQSSCAAEPLNVTWNEFRIALVQISHVEKEVSSREGMNLTTTTSPIYKGWTDYAEQTYNQINDAINHFDFNKLGELAERNALTMHATMMGCSPPLIYLLPQSWEVINKVRKLRKSGLEIYCTMDAGANVKLLFLEENEKIIKEYFPQLDIIKPFRSFK